MARGSHTGDIDAAHDRQDGKRIDWCWCRARTKYEHPNQRVSYCSELLVRQKEFLADVTDEPYLVGRTR